MKNLDTRVIVVEEKSLRPMSWSDGQFCFVDPLKLTSTRSKGFAVRTYTRCSALIMIKSHNEYRRSNGMSETKLMLMLAEHGKC